MRFDRDRALGTLLALALVGAAVYLVLQPDFVGYYFFGPGGTGHWYLRGVWGNVWACVPCGVLAFLYARAKLAAHRKAAHDEHLEAMAQAEQHHREVLASHEHVWRHVAATYERTTGKPAAPRPTFGTRNLEDVTTQTEETTC